MLPSLAALTSLSLNSNRITKLPDTIGGMTALATLYLADDALKDQSMQMSN